MDLVYFIVLVGVLVFVHELGHFACAKAFGVCVLRFSLGFGPKVAGFRRGETEYILAAIPLGGYVKMLGESPTEADSAADNKRAFSAQPLWRRLVIVVAGPTMNLLLPVLLLFFVFLGDRRLPPSVIGSVFTNEPADGRLQPGDRVLSIDGNDVATFYDVSRIVDSNPGTALHLRVQRSGHEIDVTVTPALTTVPGELDIPHRVGRIGISVHEPMAIVGVTSTSSPAALAELRTFDRIVSVRGRVVDRWRDLEQSLAENRGTTVPLTVLRPMEVRSALGGLVDFDVYEPTVMTLAPNPLSPVPGDAPGDAAGVGLEPTDLYVRTVATGGAEGRIGVMPGDRLLELDGEPILQWARFRDRMRAAKGRAHTLSWRRGDTVITHAYQLEGRRVATSTGDRITEYRLGVDHWFLKQSEPRVPNPSLLAYALQRSIGRTLDLIELTITLFGRLFRRELSIGSIAGPLTIFRAAGQAARVGPVSYLELMALLSINLALINLLPIPLLDGGQALFLLLEATLRRRFTARARQVASLIGLVLLIALIVIAVKNDVEREWPLLDRSDTSAE